MPINLDAAKKAKSICGPLIDALHNLNDSRDRIARVRKLQRELNAAIRAATPPRQPEDVKVMVTISSPMPLIMNGSEHFFLLSGKHEMMRTSHPNPKYKNNVIMLPGKGFYIGQKAAKENYDAKIRKIS